MSQISLTVRWGDAVTPILLLAALLTANPAFAEHTPAGTTLTSTAQVIYTDDGPRSVSSEPVVVTVAQRAAASVALSASSGTVHGIQAVPCTLTNAGNYSNGLAILVTKSTNTMAYIAEDINGDGVWQADENTPLRSVPALAPGASVNAFLVVSSRPGVVEGSTGSVTVFVSPLDQPDATSHALFAVTYTTPRLTPAFAFQAPEPMTSSPTIRNGLALVGTEAGALYAVKVTNPGAGTLAWRYPITGGVGAAIRSRAAADETGFYVTADDGALYKVGQFGEPIWRSQVAPAGTPMAAMPILKDGAILLACGDGRLRRIDPDTGAVLNTSQPMGDGTLGTPAAPGRDDLWVGGADGSLYDLKTDADFTILSAHAISQSGVGATPFADSRRGLVVTATHEGNVYAMRQRSSDMAWGPMSLGSPVHGSPYVDGESGIAYFAAENGYLHALNVLDGYRVTGYPANLSSSGGFTGSPVVVPLKDGKATVFLASQAGAFMAVNAAAPGCTARFDAGSTVRFVGTPAVSGPTQDDVVVAAADNGYLYGFTVRDTVVLP